MPRRQKPPGQEKWTWDEINAGRKFSKSQKNLNRMEMSFGATKREDGTIIPPTFEDNPTYYYAFGFLVLVMIFVLIKELMKSH